MAHINEEIKNTIKSFKEYDEDGYSYFDSKTGNFDYEVLKKSVEKCDKLNKEDVINLVDKYGFKLKNGVEEYNDYEGEKYLLKTRNTYETIDNIIKDKVDFDITKDKEVMLKAVSQDKNNIEKVSDENLKKYIKEINNGINLNNQEIKVDRNKERSKSIEL